MGSFASWLVHHLEVFAISLINLLTGLINSLIVAFCGFFAAVVALLPEYTVPTPGAVINAYQWLSVLNWVFPIDFMVSCVFMYIAAMITYFTVGPLLRLVKIIH